MMSKPRVWSLQQEAPLHEVCSEQDFAALQAEFDLTLHTGPEPVSAEELIAGIPGYEALLTGWGALPQFTAEFFEAATDLRILCHLAGSVRGAIAPELVEQYLLPRGLVIYTGRGAIAENVAESTVGLLIASSHRWFENFERYRRDGVWRDEALQKPDQYLLGSTLVVLGASNVGRRVLALLRGWDLTPLLYDPYVTAEQAAELGAEKVELEEALRRADLLASCLPLTDETGGMLTAARLALLRDGATFVNTSRGGVVDMEALIAEARAGRLIVGLDVTDPQEPPPPEVDWREIPNLYILPHIAGLGRYGYHRIGHGALQALRDYFASRPVAEALDLARYQQLA
ncbi:MAG: hydroxyacid dehydrogenase [candidate division WS1 bacterium]|jgi:phosphoglycerate dehydrogenase-like enzyme|nr:hydroxyacid dehydrogenase [candidate division WS1 bacterium]